MANREKGEVSFDAQGKTWTLRYSTNALCELEEATGHGAIELANSMADETKIRISDLRYMLWAGLTDKHDGITVKEAGRLMDALGMDKAGPLIGEAFQAAFPSGGEAGEAEKGKSEAA